MRNKKYSNVYWNVHKTLKALRSTIITNYIVNVGEKNSHMTPVALANESHRDSVTRRVS